MSISKIRALLGTLTLLASISLASPLLAANTAPRITGTPPTTVQKGGTYTFTPGTSDAEGNVVKCYVINPPWWLDIDHKTCRASGTVPSNIAVGTKYTNVQFLASDGLLSGFLKPVTITVTASGSTTTTSGALTLAGTPGTSIIAGSAYSFTPTLTNTTGRTATYSVSNKPSWLTFSTATGALSGTPTAAQAGSYASITLTASNGTTQSSLAPFTLTVKTAAPTTPTTPASTGAATLSWAPPTTNTSGGSLANLAGYRVYYGKSATALTQTLSLANPGLTSTVITGLATGAWYFAVTAYTTDGAESGQSTVASKTFN